MNEEIRYYRITEFIVQKKRQVIQGEKPEKHRKARSFHLEEQKVYREAILIRKILKGTTHSFSFHHQSFHVPGRQTTPQSFSYALVTYITSG